MKPRLPAGLSVLCRHRSFLAKMPSVRGPRPTSFDQRRKEQHSPAPKVLYRDIAAQAGLTARHVSGSAVDRKYILESTGSGVGLVDFDRDGFLDIFLGQRDNSGDTGTRPRTHPTPVPE